MKTGRHLTIACSVRQKRTHRDTRDPPKRQQDLTRLKLRK